MAITIVQVENKRVAKFAEFDTEIEAQAHADQYGGFVYAGAYSPELYVEGQTVTVVPVTEPVVVPASVSRRQGRLALLSAGKLDAVEAIVATGGKEAQIEYESDTWERSNLFLQAVWAQLGGDEAGLDAIFIDAGER